jgi:hypothetical protein
MDDRMVLIKYGGAIKFCVCICIKILICTVFIDITKIKAKNKEKYLSIYYDATVTRPLRPCTPAELASQL